MRSKALTVLMVVAACASADDAHLGVVVDVSKSVVDPCGALHGVVGHFLGPHGGHGTITVLATGEKASADEPRLLFHTMVPVRSRRVLDGRTAAAKARRQLMDDLVTACAAAERTEDSPILLATRRGAEQLQTFGCNADSDARCVLVVITDGEERAERAAADYIKGASEHFEVSNTISNDHIAVRVCDIANTTGVVVEDDGRQRTLTPRRDTARVQRVEEVFHGSFTRPDAVVIEPFCARSTSRTATNHAEADALASTR